MRRIISLIWLSPIPMVFMVPTMLEIAKGWRSALRPDRPAFRAPTALLNTSSWWRKLRLVVGQAGPASGVLQLVLELVQEGLHLGFVSR